MVFLLVILGLVKSCIPQDGLELAMYPRLASKLQTSCFSLLHARITGMLPPHACESRLLKQQDSGVSPSSATNTSVKLAKWLSLSGVQFPHL